MAAVLIPLRWKYRAYKYFRYGQYKVRTGNTHGPRKHSVLWYLLRAVKRQTRTLGK